MHLKDLLTPKNPRGPFKHDLIVKRSWASKSNESIEGDHHVNNTSPDTLICHTEAFDEVIDEDRPIIIGRRGSGKTFYVASLISQTRSDGPDRRKSNKTKDIIVFVDAWDQLDRIVEKVGHDARYSLGDDDWSTLLPETAARHWARRLWDDVFDRVYEACLCDHDLRTQLIQVIRFVEGKDIATSAEEITSDLIQRKFDEAREGDYKSI
jgi:hypothetical protein